MGRGKGHRLGDLLTTRALTARRCGFEMFHPAATVDEVRRIIETTDGRFLNDVEREAWASMMPASWWASFFGGWDDARKAAAGE